MIQFDEPIFQIGWNHQLVFAGEALAGVCITIFVIRCQGKTAWLRRFSFRIVIFSQEQLHNTTIWYDMIWYDMIWYDLI